MSLSKQPYGSLHSKHGVQIPVPDVTASESVMLDAVQSCVLHFDRWGNLSYANRKARQLFGLTQSYRQHYDEAFGQSFIELAENWDDPSERQREIMQVSRSGNPILGSLERVVDTGIERWFHVDKVPTEEESFGQKGVVLVLTDVSEHLRREIALKETETRYKSFISSSSEGIWRYDICPPIDTQLPIKKQVELLEKRAILVECNTRLAELFGVGHVEEIIGLPLHRNGSITNRRDLFKFVKNGYRLEDSEFTRINEFGEKTYIQNTAIGIVEKRFLTRAWGTSKNTTLQRTYLDHMEYVANHDDLTSLPNRTYLYQKMEAALKSQRHSKMALLLFDLDKFKEINDTLGHLAGDKVLKQLGSRLQSELGDMPGVLARLGGDEFAIFLPSIRNTQQAIVMGHRFLDAICEPFDIEGFYTEIEASVGVSIAPDQAQDVSTMMRYADVAMYHAKTNLKGVAIYDSEYDPHCPVRLEIMGALGRAIREGELRLHFQPKICLHKNELSGFEALLRWEHPELGFVPPSDFVPIAESSNMIYPMSKWVLQESIRHCAQWVKAGYDISVAMNLSPRNLLDERIVEDISHTLEKYQLEGRHIEVEITESMFMSDASRAQYILERISELGITLSIDDYGTGYSSLAYLKRLPVQTLKIDMSFVKNMMDNEQDAIIVSSTIQLAHNLGLTVVAEGVETEAIYDKLKELGCDALQGFYIAKPMKSEDATAWLVSSGI